MWYMCRELVFSNCIYFGKGIYTLILYDFHTVINNQR